jgi:hypothetical protein
VVDIDVAGLVRPLIARRIRRLPCPRLCVGGRVVDAAFADELRGAIDTAPVLLLGSAGTASMREVLDDAVRRVQPRAAGGPLRLTRYRTLVRLIDRKTTLREVLPPSKAWLDIGASMIAALGAATGFMQGVSTDHPALWTAGLVAFLLMVGYGLVRVGRLLWRRVWMWWLFRPGGVPAAEWLEQGRTAPGEDALLARAFLLDLAAEGGWGRLFDRRPMWIDHPVLVLPAHARRETLLAEYARLRRPPLLVITDGGPGAPAKVGRVPRWSRPILRRGARPLVRAAVAGAAVLGLTASAMAATRTPPRCSVFPTAERTGTQGGERYGVQLCGEPFGGHGPEDLIYDENVRVRESKAPAVTVLLLTSLTIDPGADPARGLQSRLAEREGLAGAYAAQKSINDEAGSHPRVQLAVANVGSRYVTEAVAEVRALLAGDPLVLASVVTVNSTTTAQRALAELRDTRLTMASTTMTADGFAAGVPGFLQVTSTNSDQVALVAGYAHRVAPGRRVTAIVPARQPGDLYLASLASAVDRAGMANVPWSPDRAGDEFLRICPAAGPAPVVYYLGRYTQFADFISDLGLICGSRRPLLIADDSVSRFIADDSLTSHLPHGTEVVVTVRGNLKSCRGLAARGSDADRANGVAQRRADFLADVRKYLGRCEGPQDRVADVAGGWAGLIYDVVRMFDNAWRRVSLIRPDLLGLPGNEPREQVFQQLVVRDAADGHAYPGAVEPLQWGAGRIARRSLALYCLPELRTPLEGTANRIAWRSDGKNHFTAGEDSCAKGTG